MNIILTEDLILAILSLLKQFNLKDIPTEDLVKELLSRENISKVTIEYE